MQGASFNHGDCIVKARGLGLGVSFNYKSLIWIDEIKKRYMNRYWETILWVFSFLFSKWRESSDFDIISYLFCFFKNNFKISSSVLILIMGSRCFGSKNAFLEDFEVMLSSFRYSVITLQIYKIYHLHSTKDMSWVII